MPGPYAHHPAIRRGHYEVKTFTVGRITATRPDGTQTIDVIATIPSLLRVVVAGLDIRAYLPEIPNADGPLDLTSDAFVQLVAPYLREGLIDPWIGRGKSKAPPVIALETEAGLSFVQAIACLN